MDGEGQREGGEKGREERREGKQPLGILWSRIPSPHPGGLFHDTSMERFASAWANWLVIARAYMMTVIASPYTL